MIRFLLIVLMSTTLCLISQAQIEKIRSINVYNVVLKTTKGNLKGVLMQATDSTIVIGDQKGIKVIPIEAIKSLNIKFATQKYYSFFQNLAKTGIDIITDPNQAHNNTKQINYTELDQSENTLSDLGGQLLIGTALTGMAIAGNELTKIVYKPNIEVFKIKKNRKRYARMHEDILWYTLNFQQSPEYETIQFEKFKSAIQATKINP